MGIALALQAVYQAGEVQAQDALRAQELWQELLHND
jgi:hypothetical protein